MYRDPIVCHAIDCPVGLEMINQSFEFGPVDPRRVNPEFPKFSYLIDRPQISILLSLERRGSFPFIPIGVTVKVVIQSSQYMRFAALSPLGKENSS